MKSLEGVIESSEEFWKQFSEEHEKIIGDKSVLERLYDMLELYRKNTNDQAFEHYKLMKSTNKPR